MLRACEFHFYNQGATAPSDEANSSGMSITLEQLHSSSFVYIVSKNP